MPPIKIDRVPCSFSLLKSKTPKILAGNILQRFSDRLQRVVRSEEKLTAFGGLEARNLACAGKRGAGSRMSG